MIFYVCHGSYRAWFSLYFMALIEHNFLCILWLLCSNFRGSYTEQLSSVNFDLDRAISLLNCNLLQTISSTLLPYSWVFRNHSQIHFYLCSFGLMQPLSPTQIFSCVSWLLEAHLTTSCYTIDNILLFISHHFEYLMNPY